MTDEIVKLLDDITLLEWAKWEWTDCTVEGEEKRTYAKGHQRAPGEFNRAYDEFRVFLSRQPSGLKRAFED